MAVAMIYPEPEKGGRGKKSEGANLAETVGFSQRRLNEARTVLRYSVDGDLANDVLGGASLDAKYARAMAVAMINPEPTKMKRKGSGSVVQTELDSATLSHARIVLAASRAKADSVLAGRWR